MPRRIQWVNSQNFLGFGCSECDWKFNPSGSPMGESLDEMKRKYEAQRDKEFAAHVCEKNAQITPTKRQNRLAVDSSLT